MNQNKKLLKEIENEKNKQEKNKKIMLDQQKKKQD